MSDLSALLAQLQATTSQSQQPEPVKPAEISSDLSALLGSLPQQNQQTQQSDQASADLKSALEGLHNFAQSQQATQQQAQQQSPPPGQQPPQPTNQIDAQKVDSDLQVALSALQNLSTQDSTSSQNQSSLSGLLGQTNQQQQNQSPLSGLLGQSQPQNQQNQSPLSGLLGQSQTQQQSPLSGLLGQPSQPQQQSPLSGLLGQPSQPQQQSPLSGLLGQPSQSQQSSLSGLLSQPAQQNPPEQNSLSSLLANLNVQNAQASSPLSSLLQGTNPGTTQLTSPSPLSSLVSKPSNASPSNSCSRTNLALEMKTLDLKEKPVPPYKKRTIEFQAKKHVTYDKSVPLTTFINNAEPYSVIEIPSGTYELVTTIQYPLHIKSANGGRATIKTTEQNEIIISASPYLILENIDFVQESSTFGAIIVSTGFTRILNCNIKCNNFSPLSIQGNSASGMACAVVEVENCHFTSQEKSCIVLQKNSTLYVSNSKLEGTQMYGIWCREESKCYVAEGCVISNHGTSGINVQKNSLLRIDKGVELINNRDSGVEVIDNSTAYIEGVKISGTGNFAAIYACHNSFTTIKNSQIVSNQSIGLRSDSESSILSINNTIKDSGAQLIIAHGNAKIQSENDSLSGNCHSAIVSIEKGYIQCNNVKVDSISGVGVVSYDHASIRMTKSSISRISQLAVQIRDGSRLYLEDVTVSDSNESGISLTRDAMAYLKRVKISKMKELGIQIANVNNGFIEIVECESFENNKGGLLIQNNIPDGYCIIKDSKFYKNANVGVNANGENTRPKFINCSFTKNGVVAIHVLNGAEVTMTNSVFKGEGNNGIFLNNAIAHIEKADFSNFSNSAVTCSNSANADLKDCVIHDNYSFGCYVSDDKSHLKLVSCKLMNHNRSGTLHCSNRSVIRCVDCKIEADLEPHAVIYNSGKVSMKNCDLTNSMKGIGIYVREDGIFKCNNVKIHDEVGKAIDIGKKGVVIAVDSTFSNNAGCGIMVGQYGSGTFTNCVFDSNGQTGIQMRGGNVTLNNCTISNHEIQGIVLTKSSNLVDNGTKFSKNGQNNILYTE